MRSTILFFAYFFVGTRGKEYHLTEQYGDFSSPNFPGVYEDDLREEWTIEVRNGYRIKIQFTSFYLEDSYEQDKGPCIYDYVLVTEGNNTIGRFCGNASDAPNTNDWFKTKGNKTNVLFVSDYSNEDIFPTGFAAHYVEEDIDECADLEYKRKHIIEDWDEFIYCNHFCHNVPASYYCSCRTGYTLHENEHTCVAIADCVDQKLTAAEGVIQSPDYPNPYAKLSHCTWDIQVGEGMGVLLTFNKEFEIEEHDDEKCAYDILEITSNGKTEPHCGDAAPGNGETMDMNTRNVKIEFRTDLSVEMKGFRIIYNTSRIRCLDPLTNPKNGNIASSNPKGYYHLGDIVNFKCDTGYDLKGSSNLACLSNGKWDHEQPKCTIKSCGKPKNLIAVKNGHIVDFKLKKFKYLERVTVKCDEWYEMTSGSATWRCENNKKWVKESDTVAPNPPKDLPTCRPICGIKGAGDNSLLSVLIAGGKESLRHEWPWMVFLNFGAKDLGTHSFSCGGSLISPNYVLTAAHCVNSTEYPDDIRWANRTHVWLGVHDRDEDPKTVQYVQVDTILIHPNYYTPTTWNYDVALIRLRQTIVMGKAIRPVCLPSTDEEFSLNEPGGTGEVAGWGRFNGGPRASDALLHAEFPIVSHTDCWGSFQSRSLETKKTLPKNLNLTANMFCAGDSEGRQSTCQGDSGGPFVMTKSGSSVYYEVGLVSFGIGDKCGEVISYTGFTKMNREIVKWIMENTNYLE